MFYKTIIFVFLSTIDPSSSLTMERTQKHGTLSFTCSVWIISKYLEKIPLLAYICLVASLLVVEQEVRHEMCSPFRYRCLPTNQQTWIQFSLLLKKNGIFLSKWRWENEVWLCYIMLEYFYWHSLKVPRWDRHYPKFPILSTFTYKKFPILSTFTKVKWIQLYRALLSGF